ncbi:MAG: hypothetical protein GYA33_01615 [Thermogutta sp.]|nr:hypothetical protein [Thermogutta sp.]
MTRYRLAATLEERLAALRLVHDAYVRAGLIEPNSHGVRATPYHVLPTTTIFVGECDCGRVISTMSLVGDGELGLPLETVYGPEIARRRGDGKRMAEVSCLAADPAQVGCGMEVFIHLCRLMTVFAIGRRYDELVIAVHPRHAKFYQRMLAFRVFGELREYPSVKDHPAVALYLDLHNMQRLPAKLYRFLLDSPYRPEDLCVPRLSDSEYRLFEECVDTESYPLPSLGPFESDSKAEPGAILVA